MFFFCFFKGFSILPTCVVELFWTFLFRFFTDLVGFTEQVIQQHWLPMDKSKFRSNIITLCTYELWLAIQSWQESLGTRWTTPLFHRRLTLADWKSFSIIVSNRVFKSKIVHIKKDFSWQWAEWLLSFPIRVDGDSISQLEQILRKGYEINSNE